MFANVRRCAQRWRRQREREQSALGDLTPEQIEARFASAAAQARASGRFRLTAEDAWASRPLFFVGYGDNSAAAERHAMSA